jgi:ribosomal protein L35
MRTKCGKSHLRRKKPTRAKRLYDGLLPVSTPDRKRAKRLLPYG